MSGRNVDSVATIPGRYALSVNHPGTPTPKGWQWVKLTDVARLESGHTPSRTHPEYWDGDIAWIGIKDAREAHGGRIAKTLQTVTQAGIDNSAARVLPAETVCLSRTASVGYVVVMGRPMATSQDFVNWVCSAALNPRFLMWTLLAEGSEGLKKFGKGSTHTTIYFPEVMALHLCLPPLNEQRRIVEKLDAVFEKSRAAKARLERLPALLDQLKRSILAAAFRGDLTKDWRAANPDVEPASVLLERIRAERRRKWEEALRAKGKDPKKATYEEPAAVDTSELPELPTGWTWATVDHISDLQLGQQRDPNHAVAEQTFPYIRAANIKWSGLDLSDVKRMGFPDSQRYMLEAGDVLLSEASGSASEVGKPAIWRNEIPGCCYQKTLLRARPRSADIPSEWIHGAFLADALLGRFAEMAPGVGILHLTADRMLSWPMPIAPREERQVIVALLDASLKAVARLEAKVLEAHQRSVELEQAALAKAFRGELVPQDPADEPAEVLLERLLTARAAEPVARRTRTTRPAATAPAPTTTALAGEPVDRIIAVFRAARRQSTSAIADATGLDAADVRSVLKSLERLGKVSVEGKARGTTYVWQGDAA